MSVEQGTDFVKSQSFTIDAFLNGRIVIAQPRSGFRAGLDSVLLGASLRMGTEHLLDLGAGAGTAALVALAHDQGARGVLVEREPELVALSRDNLERNGLAGRAQVIEADIGAAGAVREQAGIVADHYTSVIANPPFFDAAGGTRSADGARSRARHMAEGGLDLWVKAAATAAAPDGEAIFVVPAADLGRLLAAYDRRFGAVTVLPLVPREGEAALRVLVRGVKGSRAPLTLLSPLALHGKAGRDFAPLPEAIFRGRERLHW